MKQVLIIAFIVFSINLSFSQVCKPKLEQQLTVVQQVEYINLTECLSPMRLRIEGYKYTYPCFMDEEGNVFRAIVKNGHVLLVEGESFDYAQN